MKNDKEYNRQEAIIEACNDALFIHYLKGYLGNAKMGECAIDYLRYKNFKTSKETSNATTN
jgi:hypothetical protein